MVDITKEETVAVVASVEASAVVGWRAGTEAAWVGAVEVVHMVGLVAGTPAVAGTAGSAVALEVREGAVGWEGNRCKYREGGLHRIPRLRHLRLHCLHCLHCPRLQRVHLHLCLRFLSVEVQVGLVPTVGLEVQVGLVVRGEGAEAAAAAAATPAGTAAAEGPRLCTW